MPRINIHPCTVGPILKGSVCNNSIGKGMKEIGIWVRGKQGLRDSTFGIAVLGNGEIKTRRLKSENDYIHVFKFDDDGSQDFYRAGYFYWRDKEGPPPDALYNWGNVQTYAIFRDVAGPLSFVFGSCRIYINGWKKDLFGTGLEGDRIYHAISESTPLDFMLNLGDKVYFDPAPFKYYETLSQKRALYKKIYNFPNQKYIQQHVPSYDICDDRDLHLREAGQRLREAYPKTFCDGLKAYLEYQHHSGPDDSICSIISPDIHYKFECKGAHFFVFDCRTQRCELENPPYMINPSQENDFMSWLKDPKKRGKYKFIATSVPLLSQDKRDGWWGFPLQQARILKAICGVDYDDKPIDKVVILTAQAHCSRLGVYSIFEKIIGNVKETVRFEQIGVLPEILSSGLVTINHSRGKPFTRFEGLREDYDSSNDFPHTLDNTPNGGVKIVTQMSSDCFPHPSSPRNVFERIKWLFSRITDNLFIKIQYDEDRDKLVVKIINQDNHCLREFYL